MDDIFNEDFKLNEVTTVSHISKAYLERVSDGIVSGVFSGDDNPLGVYIKAKALSTLADNVISAIKTEALDEAKKYSKDDSSMLGVDFVVKSGSVKYSFDHDLDCLEMIAEIESLQDQMSLIQNKLKARQKMMIEATKYAQLVDDVTGEVIPPAVIEGYGQDVLTINIPKK